MIRREVIEYDETFLELGGVLYRVVDSLDGTSRSITRVRLVGDLADTEDES